MSRIKIKCRKNGREEKLQLLEILCRKYIEISRITATHDGFVVLTVDEHSADSLFLHDTKNELMSKDFSPIMPPEMRAKKSIIIPRVDDVIYEETVVDIGEELIRENTWMGEIKEIEDVYKFPNSPTLKITFSQTQIAKLCTEKGLKAFKISIPPQEITIETYVPVKCCMRCYNLEDHYTNECPRGKEYKVCSECSSEDHVWHQCRAGNKQCINCNGSHSTLAMQCIKRKEIIKNKRALSNEKQNMTYANIAQASTTPKVATPILPQVSKEEILLIHICVVHAQVKDQQKPGTYAKELNKILKENKLPSVIIPDEPDVTAEQPEAAATSQYKTQQPESTAQTPSISRQSSSSDLSVKQKTTTDSKLNSKDLGLEFYTIKEKGWPQNYTTDKLIKDIRSNDVKYRYTNNKFTEEEILRKTERGEIKLSNCWYSVDIGQFKQVVEPAATSSKHCESNHYLCTGDRNFEVGAELANSQ